MYKALQVKTLDQLQVGDTVRLPNVTLPRVITKVHADGVTVKLTKGTMKVFGKQFACQLNSIWDAVR